MTEDDFTIEFSQHEFMMLNNALNETCNGVPIPRSEFELQVGCSEERAQLVLRKIHDHQGSVIILSIEELLIIICALNVTLDYVGDWECPIRVGCTPDELELLLKKCCFTLYSKIT